MYQGWEEDWVDAFAQAASKGADCGTARAIAWAQIRSKRQRNPAAALAAPPAKGKRRRRLYEVPPLRKGKPSTWRKTKTGAHRARLGSLPEKWRSEWVRVYKKQYESIRKRSDLNEHQAKTVAAMSAWDALKKMGCRLPKSARPSPAKGAATPPNKRSRDRHKRLDGWVCPEWETTEKARAKVVEEVRKESEGVTRRERARIRKEEAAAKKAKKASAKTKREAEKAAKKARKETVGKQTAKEYSEAFKKEHGAHGLLPPEPRKPKKKASKKKSTKGKSRRVSPSKKYDKSKKYKVGDIISHPTFGLGVVRSTKGKTMEVKFQNRTDGRQVRDLRMG